MSVPSAILAHHGFRRVFECRKDERGVLRFIESPDAPARLREGRNPMIYAWVSPRRGDQEVLYVGKASLGVSQRMRQHENGMRSLKDTVGQKNRRLIDALLADGRQMFVYARVSGATTILGVNQVSLVSAEEEAAAELLAPAWNRAVFATARLRRQVDLPLPPKPTRKPPTEATSVPERFRIGTWDFSALTRADVFADFCEGLGDAERRGLVRLITWVGQLQVAKGAEATMIRRYSGLPTGYSGVPTVLIAVLGQQGRAKRHSWIARIPLRSDTTYPLTVVLPQESCVPGLSEDLIARSEGCFRPLELEHFLQDPSKYTKLR